MIPGMRTTIRIDEDLMKRVKLLAQESGKSVTDIVEDALRDTLARQEKNLQHHRVRLVTFHGSGLQPGIDLDDSDGLLDRLDSKDAPGWSA
jgi:Arc/MetJ family transcription regulator